MTWGDVPPTADGSYWFQPTYSDPEVVRVYAVDCGDGRRIVWFERPGRRDPQPVVAGVGRWAGPLRPPD